MTGDEGPVCDRRRPKKAIERHAQYRRQGARAERNRIVALIAQWYEHNSYINAREILELGEAIRDGRDKL